MRPPPRENNFEKVVIGEFINGTVADIEYDEQHKFKGYQGNEDRITSAVRLVFELDGYEYPHRTRWMTFSYGEKTNLFNKYLVKLVKNAEPDMDFDLDNIKGLKVKTIWQEKNGFQSIEAIYPLGERVDPDVEKSEPIDLGDDPDEELLPEEESEYKDEAI